MNKDNLINLRNRNPNDRIEIARKGGKASGIKRKYNKTIRDELITLLELKDENGVMLKEKISLRLISEANSGNVKAFELIYNIIYGKNYNLNLEIDNTPCIIDDI